MLIKVQTEMQRHTNKQSGRAEATHGCSRVLDLSPGAAVQHNTITQRSYQSLHTTLLERFNLHFFFNGCNVIREISMKA